MTDQRTSSRQKAEQILRDMGAERGDTQTRQVRAAEAQAWASLAIAEALSVAAESLHGDLTQILQVFPKSTK